MLNRNTIYDRAFAPFGEMYDTFGVTTMRDFTGDTQDIFSASPGLYDTPNRELQTTQGRWISPDPMFGNIADPQSLNRYAYVRNSPLTLVDPSGLAQTGETIKTDDVDFSFLAGDDKDSTKKTPDQTISLTFDARLLHHQKTGSNPPPPGPGGDWRFMQHGQLNQAGGALHNNGRTGGMNGFYCSCHVPNGRQFPPAHYDSPEWTRWVAVGSLFLPMATEMVGVGAEITEAGEEGTALVPLADSAMALGSVPRAVGGVTSMAGYTIVGTSGVVGDTYAMNVSLLLNAGEGQGMSALSEAIVSQAEAQGATRISITGVRVMDQGFMNPAVAQRLGWSFRQINSNTINLLRSIK